MVRFLCFSSSTTQHRPKVFSQVDRTMLVTSKKDFQDPTVNPATGSASPNQMANENNCSAVSGHHGSSTSSHQECWRSEGLNRSACSDDSKEVGRLKKSQSLGNILQKDRDHCYSEGTECDDNIDHDFNSATAIRETIRSCSIKNVDAFDGSSDLISYDLCDPSGDHGMDSDSHHMSYSQIKFPRSQSALFQNNSTSDHEGSVDSEILGSRCRSVDDLSSLFDEKVDHMSISEIHRSRSNLDLYSGPPDIYRNRTLDMEDNGSLGCSDAADEGQRSSGSAEENFVRDGMLVGHEYWDFKYISDDRSVNPVAPFSADSRDVCPRSANNGGLCDAIGQEIEEKVWNRDSTLHGHSLLVVEVPDSRNMPNIKDIGEEPEHGKTDIDGDPNELSPRTYSIKRTENWINQINMDDITVDEQGENSFSASAKSNEPVAGFPAVRPDAKSPLGMEIAYAYISKLTPVSSSAQLANLGLVAIPKLSAFSGLRLLNLSGNSIVRVTAGALPKGLHMLSLSKNNISTIEGLRELTRLRLLDLSYNRISRIGHGLASCSSLKELYLAGNKISEVDGLHRLLKLKVLDLRYNKISTSKGLGQLAANYSSLEAINLDGNPAQKNVGDERLKKHVLGLLPNLVVYNKHPTRAAGSKDASDRHSRKINSSHRSDRGVTRSDRKSSQLVGGSSASHKTQSSRHHARCSGYAAPGSGSFLLKHHPRVRRNTPMPLLGSRPASAVDLTKQTRVEG